MRTALTKRRFRSARSTCFSRYVPRTWVLTRLHSFSTFFLQNEQILFVRRVPRQTVWGMVLLLGSDLKDAGKYMPIKIDFKVALAFGYPMDLERTPRTNFLSITYIQHLAA